jgi:uncharacterized pyridoxamine 5'-phosphate oxidase family protein
MNRSLIQKIKSIGLSYKQYLDLTKKEIETSNQFCLTEKEKKKLGDKKLNLHRMTRIEKHYCISNDLKNLIYQIKRNQIWMIISETWCGDSAQNIPFIAKIVELNPKINLKIILRDENPEIMDLYLTDRSRSIPILVAYDEMGKEIFRWGSRPQEAQKLIDELKSKGLERPIILEKLHLWYGRNRGKILKLK